VNETGDIRSYLPQIVNLDENAGFQSVIVDVISSIIMIWMTEI
jgi:hypothetical protein